MSSTPSQQSTIEISTVTITGDKISQLVPVAAVKSARVLADYLDVATLSVAAVSDDNSETVNNASSNNNRVSLLIPTQYAANFNHYTAYLATKERLSLSQLKLALESAHYLEDADYFDHLVRHLLLPGWDEYGNILPLLHADLKSELYPYLPYSVIVRDNPTLETDWLYFEKWLKSASSWSKLEFKLGSHTYTYKVKNYSFGFVDFSVFSFGAGPKSPSEGYPELEECISGMVFPVIKWIWKCNNKQQYLLTKEIAHEPNVSHETSIFLDQTTTWYQNGQIKGVVIEQTIMDDEDEEVDEDGDLEDEFNEDQADEFEQDEVEQDEVDVGVEAAAQPNNQDQQQVQQQSHDQPKLVNLKWTLSWYESGRKKSYRLENQKLETTIELTWYDNSTSSFESTTMIAEDHSTIATSYYEDGTFKGEGCCDVQPGQPGKTGKLRFLDGSGNVITRRYSGNPLTTAETEIVVEKLAALPAEFTSKLELTYHLERTMKLITAEEIKADSSILKVVKEFGF